MADLSWLGSAISASGALTSSLLGAGASSKNIKRSIASQEKMNADNVAFQERANKQNIDFQREVNSIMRNDSNNAIRIKKQDLINSGYSTADPSLTGATAASLGSPTLTAPQVQSEYTPEMAAQQLQSFQSVSDSLINSASMLADTNLKRAQAEGIGRENDWIDAKNKLLVANLAQDIENKVANKDLTKEQAKVCNKQLYVMDEQIGVLFEQSREKALTNQFVYDRCKKELRNLDSVWSQMQASIANMKADTDNKKVQKVLLEHERDLKKIELKFAEMGINFNGSSMLDALLRIVASDKGGTLVNQALHFLSETFRNMLDIDPTDSIAPDVTTGLVGGLAGVRAAQLERRRRREKK